MDVLGWPGWAAVGVVFSLLSLIGVVVAVVQLRESQNLRPKWGLVLHVEGHGLVRDGVVTRRFTIRPIGNEVMYEARVYARGLQPAKSDDTFRKVMTSVDDPFLVEFNWPEDQERTPAWVGITWVQPRASSFRLRGARADARRPTQDSFQVWKNYRWPRFHHGRGRWVPMVRDTRLGPDQYV